MRKSLSKKTGQDNFPVAPKTNVGHKICQFLLTANEISAIQVTADWGEIECWRQ